MNKTVPNFRCLTSDAMLLRSHGCDENSDLGKTPKNADRSASRKLRTPKPFVTVFLQFTVLTNNTIPHPSPINTPLNMEILNIRFSFLFNPVVLQKTLLKISRALNLSRSILASSLHHFFFSVYS